MLNSWSIPFDLQTIWFILIGILLAGYAILDGFDLGIGMLYLTTKNDTDRRILLNAIGPVWDGNEVWLVTGGGALFAAFPDVYATIFSGMYYVIMLLLSALIFRAVAIEFRSKNPKSWWRTSWDIAFSMSSFLITILIGIALGNIIQGIALGPDKEYIGTFMDFMRPFPILVGILTVAAFMMHGALFALLKTENTLQDTFRKISPQTTIFFIIMTVTVTMVALVYFPHMSAPFRERPIWFILPVLLMLSIANIPRAVSKRRNVEAFFSSGTAIGLLLWLGSLAIFPNLVPSQPNPEFSLTIYNSSSSEKTLRTMLFMASLGVPFVLAYTVSIYWIFRGKVKLEDSSY